MMEMPDRAFDLWNPSAPKLDPATGRYSEGAPPVLAPSGGGGNFDDLFGYTKGSLLTPWTEKFQYGGGGASSGGAGGSGVLDRGMRPFDFGRINVDRFDTPEDFQYEGFDRPADFTYDPLGDFEAWRPTTEADLLSDPSYQFRTKQGLGALEASAAAKGTLRTGGTLKGLIDYGQEAASQEFGAVDARRLRDWRTNWEQGITEQGIRYGQAADTSDRNFGQRFAEYNAEQGNRLAAADLNRRTRLGAYGANLQGEFGAWDRNFSNYATGYGYDFDRMMAEAQFAEAGAGRAAAAGNADYSRAWNEYLTDYDIFERNQQKQFDRQRWQTELGLATE